MVFLLFSEFLLVEMPPVLPWYHSLKAQGPTAEASARWKLAESVINNKALLRSLLQAHPQRSRASASSRDDMETGPFSALFFRFMKFYHIFYLQKLAVDVKVPKGSKGWHKRGRALEPSTLFDLCTPVVSGTSYPWRIHGAGIYANIKGIQYIDGIHGTPNI